MTGKLDEISAEIGALKAITATLTRLFERHCDDDDRRHDENLKTLREINESVRALQPLAKTVALMEPIVRNYQISHLKLTGALGLAALILTTIGWLIEGLLGHAAGWLIDKLH